MLNSSSASGQDRDAVVIKKYANRRLYNTESSTYVTLEDLAAMVRSDRDFIVYDAKTGEDLTHSVLTQIIVEQEGRAGGQPLLPVPFLRQLIRFYDDALGKMVPGYLQFSLDALAKEQEKFRTRMASAFGNPGVAFEVYQDQVQKNIAMFENAMSMWAGFAQRSGDAISQNVPPSATAKNADRTDAGETGGASQSKDALDTAERSKDTSELEDLRAELAKMSARIEQLSKTKD